MIIIRQQSGGFEFRIKSLMEEVNALRAALSDRENIIAKLRIEISQNGEQISKIQACNLGFEFCYCESRIFWILVTGMDLALGRVQRCSPVIDDSILIFRINTSISQCVFVYYPILFSITNFKISLSYEYL